MNSASGTHMARLLVSVGFAPMAVVPVFAVYALALVVNVGVMSGLLLFALEVVVTALAGAYVTTVVGGLPTLLLLHAFGWVTPGALTCAGAALGLLAGWLVASALPFPLLSVASAAAGGLSGWWFAKLYRQPRSPEVEAHAA